MATSRIPSVFLSLVLVLLFFVTRVPAAPNDEADVRKAVAGFPESWNHHDMDAFGKLFAMDADFVNVAGDWWHGRQDIQEQHAYSHGTIPADTKGFEGLRVYYGIFKTSTLRFTRIDVRLLGNDAAVARAGWELLGDTRTPKPRRGLFMFILVRQGGGWLIVAAQNTEIERTVK